MTKEQTAQNIYHALKVSGADIGNAAIGIIEKELEELAAECERLKGEREALRSLVKHFYDRLDKPTFSSRYFMSIVQECRWDALMNCHKLLTEENPEPPKPSHNEAM